MSGMSAVNQSMTFANSAPLALQQGAGARDDRAFALTLAQAREAQRPCGVEDATRRVGTGALSRLENSFTRPAKSREERLRESAQQLVASALLMPVLEQMEVSPLAPKTGPFAQNIVQQRFGPMLHQHMADRIMQSRGRAFGLVDAVVRRFGGESLEATA